MSYTTQGNFLRNLKYEVGSAMGVRIKLFLLLYRLASYIVFKGGVVFLLGLPIYILYRFYSEFLVAAELPVNVIAGSGLRVFHAQGLVVHAHTKIGDRCTLRQGVTIGNKKNRDGTMSACPVIGDDVDIGAGAVIIGEIKIGSRVSIGANTVVTKDVPDDMVVVGQSARYITKDV